MTDVELQDTLIRELKGMKLQKLDEEEWREYKVYKQNEPFKDEDDPDGDYIIVIIDDEDTDKEDGRWIVTIQMILQVVSDRTENDGEVILANLMNQIDFALRRKGIIGRRYEMQKEAYKRFNKSCPPGYYQSAYITKWKMPEINMEGVGDLT